VRLTRVYVEEPLAVGKSCSVEGSAANHIMRVLRARDGDPLTLFDGRGGEYGARIKGFRKDSVQVDVQEHRDVERESALDLTLVQGVSRGERMDWVVQKATELGVRRIVPILTERSVVKLDERQSEKKLQHWRAIAISACEQCGRNRVPEVAAPSNFFDAIRATDASAARLLLSPTASLRSRDLPRPTAVTLLIGPEGGLADNEEEFAIRTGFQPVQLGPRILRTETAAIAALAALQHDFGDL
jgi:16S rRNA (uracil1498-N3)-methyltransferase